MSEDNKDTFECGGFITVNGKRYVVAETTCYPTNGGIHLSVVAAAYEHCEPIIPNYHEPKKTVKPKKRRAQS